MTTRSIPRIRILGLACAGLLFLACGPSSGEGDAASSETSRAQRDSAVAESGLPGSSGVGTALEAVENANARTEAHDTLQ